MAAGIVLEGSRRDGGLVGGDFKRVDGGHSSKIHRGKVKFVAIEGENRTEDDENMWRGG